MLKRINGPILENKIGIPLFYKEESDLSFKDIILPKYLINSFSIFEKEFNNKTKLKEQGAYIPNKLLFSGVSGCGKSCVVRALANSLNLSLFCVDMSELVLISGDTFSIVENLLKVINYTYDTNSILFFDNWGGIEVFDQNKYLNFIVNKIKNLYVKDFIPIMVCAISSSDYKDYFDIEMKFCKPISNEIINFIRNNYSDLEFDDYELSLLLPFLEDKSYKEIKKVIDNIKNQYILRVKQTGLAPRSVHMERLKYGNSSINKNYRYSMLQIITNVLYGE
jgi:AAA+ superfamily predicted ATPase